jgi:hypothetical protein
MVSFTNADWWLHRKHASAPVVALRNFFEFISLTESAWASTASLRWNLNPEKAGRSATRRAANTLARGSGVGGWRVLVLISETRNIWAADRIVSLQNGLPPGAEFHSAKYDNNNAG